MRNYWIQLTVVAMLVTAETMGCMGAPPQPAQPPAKPCPTPAPPQAKVHATPSSDGGFSTSASCPKGWKVDYAKSAMNTYAESDHGYADMINLMAEARCVSADKAEAK